MMIKFLGEVSMPHAALWVVQHFSQSNSKERHGCFNAARGFVGGATRKVLRLFVTHLLFQCRTRLCGWCNLQESRLSSRMAVGFNAARGFVGGATASLAALVPLGGKSPFGKSPKI